MKRQCQGDWMRPCGLFAADADDPLLEMKVNRSQVRDHPAVQTGDDRQCCSDLIRVIVDRVEQLCDLLSGWQPIDFAYAGSRNHGHRKNRRKVR